MLSRIVQAALLRRDPYLFMVLAVDGVADAAMIVGATSAVVSLPLLSVGVLFFLRAILSGVVGWIILSGLVYLVGRHLLEGDGSWPGVMAAVGIAYPVVLTTLLLDLFMSYNWAFAVSTLWLVAAVSVAARVALDLTVERAAMAAAAGWVGLLIVRSIFSL